MHKHSHTTSQIAGIESYLLAGKALTPAEALTNFGCFRLAARIKELKDRAVNPLAIVTTIKTNPVSRNKYASYSLSAPLEVRTRVMLMARTASDKVGLMEIQGVAIGTIGRVTSLSDRSATVMFTGKHAPVWVRKEDLQVVADRA